MLAVAAFGLAAVFFGPGLPPLPGSSDDDVLSYERSQRRFRTVLGLPLPGRPELSRLQNRLSEAGLAEGAPVFIRIFKREFELELWMKRDREFKRFATYPICRFSGKLGPKFQQGDSQSPEGFYTVDKAALNPFSRWHRSFNIGYPNAFDQAHNRTGSLIMVHGGCASVGCFAMTNDQIDEIWQLVTTAFDGGQKRFSVQVFPFRMTDDALEKRATHPAAAFWRTLKPGYDLFEQSHTPPLVSVCNGAYAIERGLPGSAGDSPVENRCRTASNAREPDRSVNSVVEGGRAALRFSGQNAKLKPLL